MYEVDFLPVGDGNGDAICVRYGNDQTGYWLHVIDGGFTDTSDTIISHIETHYGAHYKINHMVLSHADNDHATGLIGVLNRFEVGAIWMNRPWRFAQQVLPAYPGYTVERLVREMREKHPYLVEIEKIAASRGTPIYDVFRGADIGPFKVLAPHQDRYIRTIPNFEKTPEAKRPFVSAVKTFLGDAVEAVAKWANEEWHVETLSNDPDPPTSDSNESSVVQLGTFEGGRTILLAADVGPVGLNEAADYAKALGLLAPPGIVQVPHHGSRKNVTPAVLDRWLGPSKVKGAKTGSACVSVGKEKSDYPRGQVQNAFERRGYPVHATRGKTKHYYHGRDGRPDWGDSTPEPWVSRVEL